jgi:cytidylate kinase
MSSIESIIDRQIRRWELERQVESAEPEGAAPGQFRPLITVSRQRGSRGSYIAEKLADRFGYTLLHRDLIDRICESSGYKRRIVESLDQRSRSRLESWFSAVIEGKYVDHSDYTRRLGEVIYSIAELGGVVVVGRGANLIVGPKRGFHVRVVAPVDVRRRNLVAFQNLSESEADAEIEAKDRERAEFVKKQLSQNIDSPLLYDLVVNSSHMTVETATGIIATAALEKFESIRGELR